ncbi:MAG: ArsR/SmtB family transcription factor [Paracoccaceae bacterium]
MNTIFKAASDPTRRSLLTLLAQQGPMRVTDLAGPFDMSLNSISKHIKVLENAGLVRRRTEWREHIIEVQMDPLRHIDRWFSELRSIWAMQLDALDQILIEETANDDD